MDCAVTERVPSIVSTSPADGARDAVTNRLEVLDHRARSRSGYKLTVAVIGTIREEHVDDASPARAPRCPSRAAHRNERDLGSKAEPAATMVSATSRSTLARCRGRHGRHVGDARTVDAGQRVERTHLIEYVVTQVLWSDVHAAAKPTRSG